MKFKVLIYLPFASFIHCSSTGFIFWALLGVISSFSNLEKSELSLFTIRLKQTKNNIKDLSTFFFSLDVSIQFPAWWTQMNARTFFPGAIRFFALRLQIILESWFTDFYSERIFQPPPQCPGHSFSCVCFFSLLSIQRWS